MNKRIIRLQMGGFIFVCIIGTLMHFLYELSGGIRIIGMFCPVNESPWEHLKMIFFPFLLFIFYQKHTLKKDKFNIFSAGLISVITGQIATLAYFYTINGIIGGNNEWVNLSSFFVGVGIMIIIDYFLIINSVGKGFINGLSLAVLIIISLIFVLFTFEPPIIPLFQDPINLSFGI